MKLSALALDYDGTIATDGRLSPAVRDAIGEVRRHGIVVVLATGRRLADLHRVAGDLQCFDAVVGENGAVLEFPSSGRHTRLGHPPNPDVLEVLRQRKIDVTAGECVIEADASAAPAVLEAIRTLELPLVLAFNRGRLMVLPQAVSKSTGLRQALFALRLSIHNTIGIGDAENDHDLLDACEVGVAVEWGSAALRAVADEVIEGTGPEAVADYLRRACQQPRLSARQMGRRQLVLGHEHNGQEVGLAMRGRNVFIAGEPGSGKSWLAGLLCEQHILQGYSLCVIDPEGDYRSLESLPGVTLLGGDDPPPQARELARALRHPDVSVVIDLCKLSHHAKVQYVDVLLPVVAAMRRQTGLPHRIVLDEAHYFLGKHSERLIDFDLAGYTLITYRISGLEPSIRLALDAVVVVTRETDPLEVETLQAMCLPESTTPLSPTIFRDLATNEAALLPGSAEASGRVRQFQIAPRLTAHVRHQSKYLDMPVGDGQAFVFSTGGRPGARALTLKAFTGLLLTLPGDLAEGHVRRHDFSRWLDDVFRDHPLAAHVRGIEARVQTDGIREIVEAIAQAIRARYELASGRERLEHI
jgi:hydroxymethylpyrimidine pyrophosphatase-like HAD family hydrolase